MRDGWVESTLGETCEFFNGKAHEKQIDENGKYIVVNSKFISSNGESFKRTNNALFPLKIDDIVMVMSDVPKGKALAKCLLIDKDGTYSLNQRICCIRSEKFDKKFLFYHLNRHPYLLAFDNKENQTNLRKSDILNCPLLIPSMEEQKRIVAILDETFAGIDTAIANTEKNLANARELFESYLDAVAHDKQPMGDFVTIKTGKLNANAAVEGGKYPFFTCSREIYEIDNYAFDCEAILLAGNNASGDFNVKHYEGKFNAYQRTYVITINDTKSLSYRFLYFQLLKSLKELKRSSVGAGTKFLKLGMIQSLKISVPSIDVQEEILNKLEFLMENSRRLESIYQQKIDSLYELKQVLLQKAFTGELTEETNKLMDEEVA